MYLVQNTFGGGEQVVLKRMIAQTEEMSTLIAKEVKLMKSLVHPKIVKFLGHSSQVRQ